MQWWKEEQNIKISFISSLFVPCGRRISKLQLRRSVRQICLSHPTTRRDPQGSQQARSRHGHRSKTQFHFLVHIREHTHSLYIPNTFFPHSISWLTDWFPGTMLIGCWASTLQVWLHTDPSLSIFNVVRNMFGIEEVNFRVVRSNSRCDILR